MDCLSSAQTLKLRVPKSLGFSLVTCFSGKALTEDLTKGRESSGNSKRFHQRELGAFHLAAARVTRWRKGGSYRGGRDAQRSARGRAHWGRTTESRYVDRTAGVLVAGETGQSIFTERTGAKQV